MVVNETVLKQIKDMKEKMIDVAEEIWSLAELGMQEFKSSRILGDWLESEGFKVTWGIAEMPTAFLAEWGAGRPIIGFQAEYDAMPNQSNEPVPYKKPVKEGAPGHGCGHNLIGTCATAAGIAVKRTMEKECIKGTIRVYGTPAEEIIAGKVYITRAGLYNDLDAGIYWHPTTKNVVNLGSTLALVSTIFEFKSKSSGYFGRNALDGINTMRSIVDINLASAVNLTRKGFKLGSRISHVIRDGGGEPNVPPETAQIWYFLRAPNVKQVKRMHDEVKKCAEAAALGSGTDVEEKIQSGCYNYLENHVLANVVYENMKAIGAPKFTKEEKEWAVKLQEPMREAHVSLEWALDENIGISDEMSLGSQDDGDCSWLVPYTHFGTCGRVNGIVGHTWMWTAVSGHAIGHKAMMFACKVLANSTIDILTDPEILRKARAEFEEATKDFVYECLVPPGVKPPNANFFKVEAAKIPS
jgi:aminobenzoyl-glutamate utilization protein B